MWKALRIVLLLLAGCTAAYAQSSPPPNQNYSTYNTKSDGDITTPPTGKIKFFYNGTTLRFKDSSGTFTSLGTGSGTVSSVALSLPSFITVSGSPVTSTGTLTGTLATQVKNKFFVGPATGADAAPTFRVIDAADLGTGTANSSVFLRGDLTWSAAGGSTLSSTKTPVDNTATGVFRIAAASSDTVTSGYCIYVATWIDATTHKSVSEMGKVWFVVANRNGTVTAKISDDQADGTNGVNMARDATDGSVWTNVWDASVSSTNCDIRITSNYDQTVLTSATGLVTYQVFIIAGNGTASGL